MSGLRRTLPYRSLFPDVSGRHRAWEMAAQAPLPFLPTDLGSVLTAWLQVGGATTVSGDITVLPDARNVNPALQTAAAGRRPTLTAAANGLPTMQFATNDCLSWAVIAAISGLSQWGIAFWLKPTDVSGIGMLFAAFNGTGGASAPRMRLYTQTTSLTCEVYASGSDGRFSTASSMVSTSAWSFITYEYDASIVTESLRTTVTLNAGAPKTNSFGNQGAGATTGSLVSVTGNYLLGDYVDGAGGLPYNGFFGPDIFLFGGKMADATTGLLTPGARTSLMKYQQPT